MKTTQYVKQEKAIASADKGGIRERWMYGLRLLRDPDAYNKGSSQLKPGRAEELVKAAKAAGLTLSEREIQWRLRCAKTYKTEAEFRNAITEFKTWFDLIQAGFPPSDVDVTEPLADHRTKGERQRDHARALLDLIGVQSELFSLDEFEPTTTTLKELQVYTEEMAGLTARFAERDKQRQTYLDSLIKAAEDDLSMTWQDAQERLNALDPDATDETTTDDEDDDALVGG